MARFAVNRGVPGGGLRVQFDVEAESYKEEGSFTKFYDAAGTEVKSIRTDKLLTIERLDKQ